MEIRIRPFTPEDAPKLSELGNSKNVAQYMAGRFPHPYTINDAEKYIQEVGSVMPTRSFAIVLNNELIGACGVHPQEDIFKNNAEIGYWLGEKYWGHGYVQEALKLLIPYAFQNFSINRLYARVFGNNPRSMKVLERSGFVLEAKYNGTLERFGEILDEYIYALRK